VRREAGYSAESGPNEVWYEQAAHLWLVSAGLGSSHLIHSLRSGVWTLPGAAGNNTKLAHISAGTRLGPD
jgi:hypothetical protein